MGKITWNCDLEKETKGTKQYKDADNRKHMIYIPKEELKKIGDPETITVTITTGKE